MSFGLATRKSTSKPMKAKNPERFNAIINREIRLHGAVQPLPAELLCAVIPKLLAARKYRQNQLKQPPQE